MARVNSYMTMSFKTWLAEFIAGSAGPGVDDPSLRPARDQAATAAVNAAKKGADPVAAAQDSVMQAVKKGMVPLNKMAELMPKNDQANMKKKMKKKMKKG